MIFCYKKYFILIFSLSLFLCARSVFADVIINEVMYDLPGTDDGREWIEIRNTGDEAVDMSKWKLFENNTNHNLTVFAGADTLASDSLAIIADNPSKFLIDNPGFTGMIFDSAFSLGNSGEEISLKDESLRVVDVLSYSNSQGANGDGNSLAYADSSWIAGVPTPGEANETIIISEPEQISSPTDENEEVIDNSEPADNQTADGSSAALSDEIMNPSDEENDSELPSDETPNIFINEIMYDPKDSDDGREWVEVYNAGDSDIDLSDWKFFEGGTNHGLNLIQGNSVIPSAGFIVIASDPEKFKIDWPDFSGGIFKSSFSLSNAGETIVLKNHNLDSIDELNYANFIIAAGNGNSLQKIDGEWIASSPTPGAENVFSDSADSEEASGENTDNSEPVDPATEKIIINEIAWMGTEGNQYGEWIELYNEGDNEIDLNGWKLYKNGGDTLVFALTEKILAHEYFVIERTTDSNPDPLPDFNDEAGTFSGGGLLNLPKGEYLVLRDAAGNMIEDLDFSSAWPAGDNATKDTMQLFNGRWITAKPTPKEENTNRRTKSRTTSSAESGDAPVEAAALLQEQEENINESEPVAADVLENKILVKAGDVMISDIGMGDDLFVTISNNLSAEVDLSGWKISSLEKTFTIPEHTIILAGRSISFSQKITGFSEEDIANVKLDSSSGETIFAYARPIRQNSAIPVFVQNKLSSHEEAVKDNNDTENGAINRQIAGVASALPEEGIPKIYYYLASSLLLIIIFIVRIFLF